MGEVESLRGKTLGVNLIRWMAYGPQLVAEYGLERVEVLGRKPLYVCDRFGPGWGWQYGYRWAGPDHDPLDRSRVYTLPDQLFAFLPPWDSPVPYNTMPRWPSEEAALACLNRAAVAWARTMSRRGRDRHAYAWALMYEHLEGDV